MVTPYMCLGSKSGEVLRALPSASVAWLRVPASMLYVRDCCLLTCVSQDSQKYFGPTKNIL